MKTVFLYTLVLALALSGCITKKAAKAQAEAAFFAGQRQALLSAPQSANQGLNVQIRGEVQNPVVPWTPDMTLAKAIVAAGYKSQADPTYIIIIRNGQSIQVNPRKLLKGEDVPLLPNDVVALAAGPGPISSDNNAAHTPPPSGP